MLRHCQSDALSPRGSLDLSLTSATIQNRLAEFFRCDPWSIRRMTHFRMTRHRPDVRPPGLIATVRPAQKSAGRCSQRDKRRTNSNSRASPAPKLDGGLAPEMSGMWVGS